MKMNILHINKMLVIIGMLLMALPQAKAQQVTVDAKIDSLQLLIGEQAKITLEVSMDANQKLQGVNLGIHGHLLGICLGHPHP